MFAPKVVKPQTKAVSDSSLALQQSKPAGHRLGHDSVEQGSHLQRAISNQALLRQLVRRNSVRPGSGPHGSETQGGVLENAAIETGIRDVSWDFSKFRLLPPDRIGRAQPLSVGSVQPGTIPPKLAISAAEGPPEREAESAADQVMRMPDPEPCIAPGRTQLSRRCAACEEEDKKLKLKPAELAEPAANEAPLTVHEVLRSPGQSLDATMRAFMEPRFGHDFGHVRIHTDASAAAAAAVLGAEAFAFGPVITSGLVANDLGLAPRTAYT